jgi:putative transposase
MERPSAEGAMAKPKLSPREIVQRLQTIDALTVEGMPVADAIRSAGVLPAEYDRWRIEYNGLRRTLGPLLFTTPKLPKTTRRATRAHPVKAPT